MSKSKTVFRGYRAKEKARCPKGHFIASENVDASGYLTRIYCGACEKWHSRYDP